MRTATCTRCKARKPIEAFPVDSSRNSGHHPHCLACRAESERRRYARAKAVANVTELPKRKPSDLDETALLSPPGEPVVGPHLAELEATLEVLDLGEVDRALVGLCRTLARSMDFAHGDPREIAMVSPKYLAALRALRATPDTAAPAVTEGSALRLAAY